MKLIIEISKNRYDEIHSLKFVQYGLKSEENKKLFYLLINAVQDGTPLTESDDCVSRQAVLDATVNKNSIWNSITNSKGENLEEIISQLPSVQSKRDKGEWNVYDGYWYECSNCGCFREMPHFNENFCPNCGVKMESEDKE